MQTKPCPFCGSTNIQTDLLGNDERPFWAVSCSKCEATGPIARTDDAAIEAWNSRPPKGDGETA